MLPNNQCTTEEIKEEIKKIPSDKWQWKHDDWKSMKYSKSHSKRKVYNNNILPQETRKISSKQPNHISKATEERTNTTQS